MSSSLQFLSYFLCFTTSTVIRSEIWGFKKNRGRTMHHLRLFSPSFTIQNPRLCPSHSLSSLHSSTAISFTPQSPLLLSSTMHFRGKRSLLCRQSDYFQQQSFTPPRQPPNDSSYGGGESDFFHSVSVTYPLGCRENEKNVLELLPLRKR